MQTKKKKSVGLKIGVSSAALHLCLVTLAFITYINYSSSTAALVFIWFTFLDTPIALLPLSIFSLFGVAALLVSFGVFGSALWFLIPWLTDRFVVNILPNAGKPTRWIVVIGAVPLILYVYDSNGKLVYQKTEVIKGVLAPALTAGPVNEIGLERLLVGASRGNGSQILEYSLTR